MASTQGKNPLLSKTHGLALITAILPFLPFNVKTFVQENLEMVLGLISLFMFLFRAGTDSPVAWRALFKREL